MSKKQTLSNSKRNNLKRKSPKKARKQKQMWTWIGIGLGATAILVAIILLIPKGSTESTISAAQAYQKFQQGALFLDVRSQEEWDKAHIAKSINIPLDELQNHLNELPKNRDIVVVCLVGQRSQEGMTILRNVGFARASCMTGGLNAWKVAGYPLEGNIP
jgi:rhodanese-related sulfurtransferase